MDRSGSDALFTASETVSEANRADAQHLEHLVVQQLHALKGDTGALDIDHGVGGIVDAVESYSCDSARHSRLELERGLDDDPERALGSDEQLGQVGPGAALAATRSDGPPRRLGTTR